MGMIRKQRALVRTGMVKVKCDLCPNKGYRSDGHKGWGCYECFQLSGRWLKYQKERDAGQPITTYDKTYLEESGDK